MNLEELFASVLNVPAETLSDDSCPATVRAWNSLGHLKLISAMEEIFGIAFSSAEIRGLKTLGGARALLQAKGAL
ncbi:acyl carrier protein [Chloroflexia bacterium SDU3-3]|nr:acyl carrier protein [Chloroflexia bacterium SDU3-3]